MRRIITICALLLMAVANPAAASEETEARLREALRTAISQSRSLEDERAQLQAKNAENEKQLELLRQQLAEKGGNKAAPDKGTVEQLEAEFNRRLSAQHAQALEMNEALEKWKAAYQEAAALARGKETARVQLAGQVETLTQRATSCEAKNVELYKVGDEILNRFAEANIIDALGAREPFLGLKRVELQNLVQDYQDKLLDQKATP